MRRKDSVGGGEGGLGVFGSVSYHVFFSFGVTRVGNEREKKNIQMTRTNSCGICFRTRMSQSSAGSWSVRWIGLMAARRPR